MDFLRWKIWGEDIDEDKNVKNWYKRELTHSKQDASLPSFLLTGLMLKSN